MCRKSTSREITSASPLPMVSFALETWQSPVYVSSVLVILVNRS